MPLGHSIDCFALRPDNAGPSARKKVFTEQGYEFKVNQTAEIGLAQFIIYKTALRFCLGIDLSFSCAVMQRETGI